MKWIKWAGLVTVLIALITMIYQYAAAQYVNPPPFTRGIVGKTKGQVVALQNDAQVIAWCNFDKHIVVTATNVLCVYNGSEEGT